MKDEQLHNFLTQGLKNKQEYNFLREMFNFSNERYLHSSFITMLLSQPDQHYLKFFLEKLAMLYFPENEQDREEFLNRFPLQGQVEIHPNRIKHNEDNHIDILIKCEDTKSVIIIENKTFSSDIFKIDNSPEAKEKNEKGKGGKLISQLEYYSNLPVYKDYKKYLGYLTFRGKSPKWLEDMKEKYAGQRTITNISYDKFIIDIENGGNQDNGWLQRCINYCKSSTNANSEKLSWVIEQYLEFVKENLDTRKIAHELIRIIEEDKENLHELCNAYTKENYFRNKEEKDLFNKYMQHVKWEVINDIIYNIINGLQISNKIFITLDTQALLLNEMITSASRHDKTVKPIVFNFTYQKNNGEEILMYLSYDSKGFTVGKCKEHITKEDYTVILKEKKINIHNFSQDSAWKYIIKSNRDQLVKEISEQIHSSIEELFSE